VKRKLELVTAVGVLAVALTLVLAACRGSGNPNGVASLTDTTGQTTDGAQGSSHGDSSETDRQEALLDYARCMRSHGVRNFPDPASDGVLDIGPGVGTDSPTYRAAERECRVDTPGGS
jgi:hypothetical protein